METKYSYSITKIVQKHNQSNFKNKNKNNRHNKNKNR